MPSDHEMHECKGTDDDGRPLKPDRATCGICGRSWCDRCDPAPSALCHWCHGRGESEAPLVAARPCRTAAPLLLAEAAPVEDPAMMALVLALIAAGAVFVLIRHLRRGGR